MGMVHATTVKRGPPAGFKTLLGRYFYFCMALLMAGLAVWGFSGTVDTNLLHAKPKTIPAVVSRRCFFGPGSRCLLRSLP